MVFNIGGGLGNFRLLLMEYSWTINGLLNIYIYIIMEHSWNIHGIFMTYPSVMSKQGMGSPSTSLQPALGDYRW